MEIVALAETFYLYKPVDSLSDTQILLQSINSHKFPFPTGFVAPSLE